MIASTPVSQWREEVGAAATLLRMVPTQVASDEWGLSYIGLADGALVRTDADELAIDDSTTTGLRVVRVGASLVGY